MCVYCSRMTQKVVGGSSCSIFVYLANQISYLASVMLTVHDSIQLGEVAGAVLPCTFKAFCTMIRTDFYSVPLLSIRVWQLAQSHNFFLHIGWYHGTICITFPKTKILIGLQMDCSLVSVMRLSSPIARFLIPAF